MQRGKLWHVQFFADFFIDHLILQHVKYVHIAVLTLLTAAG